MKWTWLEGTSCLICQTDSYIYYVSMDYLSFTNFISPVALIVFYYTGALLLPLVSWGLALRLADKSEAGSRILKQGPRLLWQTLNKKQRAIALGGAILCLLLMEVFWRMLFEFLIAYMQIHEALVSAARQVNGFGL